MRLRINSADFACYDYNAAYAQWLRSAKRQRYNLFETKESDCPEAEELDILFNQLTVLLVCVAANLILVLKTLKDALTTLLTND